MKKVVVFISVLLFVVVLDAQRLVILHTNDIHSKIEGYGPENKYTPLINDNDKTEGGFARLATLVYREKRLNPNEVIMCDAGDFFMGSVFQTLENRTGFQLNLMKKIGYDVLTLGNHEFDFGPQFLADAINAGLANGQIPKIVASQLIFSETNAKDDDLCELAKQNIISPYTVIEKNGLRIGFFGLLGKDAQFVSQGAAPIKFADIIKVSRQITKKLRKEENVDIIICVSHSGVYPNKKGQMVGEDIKLAKKVPDIDIIISGHTHVETADYLQVGKTIIVQTGEYLKKLGRLEINYENKKVSVVEFKLLPLNDDVRGDKDVAEMVDRYKKEINKKCLMPYGYNYFEPIAETDFVLNKSYYLEKKPAEFGNLITDAIKYYADNYSSKTDIAIGVQGMIREDLKRGEITIADVFRAAPLGAGKNNFLGFPLAKIYLTGNDLRMLAELNILGGKPGEDAYLYFSGIEFFYKPTRPFLHKVFEIKVNGEKIDFSRKNKKLYSLTGNIFLLSFIDEIKNLSKGLVRVYMKDKNGQIIDDLYDQLLDFDANKAGVQEGKEWLAIAKYLQHFTDIDNNGLPNIPENYKHFRENIINAKNKTTKN